MLFRSRISNTTTQLGGIQFADGTFLSSAAGVGVTGPTGPTGSTGPSSNVTGPTGPTNIYAYIKTASNATAGQSTFSVNYTVGYVDVYVNGVKLPTYDYTATNGTSVTIAGGLSSGTTVEFVAWTVSSLGITGPTGPTGAASTVAGPTGYTGPANIQDRKSTRLNSSHT